MAATGHKGWLTSAWLWRLTLAHGTARTDHLGLVFPGGFVAGPRLLADRASGIAPGGLPDLVRAILLPARKRLRNPHRHGPHSDQHRLPATRGSACRRRDHQPRTCRPQQRGPGAGQAAHPARAHRGQEGLGEDRRRGSRTFPCVRSACTTTPSAGPNWGSTRCSSSRSAGYVSRTSAISGHPLTEDQISAIGSVDVVLVPVGGGTTIDAQEATHVVDQIRPRLIVIPMHYKTDAVTIKGSGPRRRLRGRPPQRAAREIQPHSHHRFALQALGRGRGPELQVAKDRARRFWCRRSPFGHDIMLGHETPSFFRSAHPCPVVLDPRRLRGRHGRLARPSALAASTPTISWSSSPRCSRTSRTTTSRTSPKPS